MNRSSVHGRCRALILLCASCVLACALDVQVIRYPDAPELAPRPADCAVKLIDWYETPGPSCRDVGDVYVGDPGMTFFRCGRERAEERIRDEACRLGASLALVRHVKDFHSSCYQARARLLQCDAGAGEQP